MIRYKFFKAATCPPILKAFFDAEQLAALDAGFIEMQVFPPAISVSVNQVSKDQQILKNVADNNNNLAPHLLVCEGVHEPEKKITL